MPAIKPGSRRAKRFEMLREDGFLFNEARELSKIPLRTAAIRAARADRKSFLHRFIARAERKGWGPGKQKTEYRAALRRKYRRMDWVVQEGDRRGDPLVWAMYRWYERDFPVDPNSDYGKLQAAKKRAWKRGRAVKLTEWLELKDRKTRKAVKK